MSDNQKRSQYKIKLFHFHELSISFGQLSLPENTNRIITVSNSIYLDQLQQVVAMHDPFDNFTDAIFMLKADGMDEDDQSQLALFERMLREGIYYKGEKYVRSIKSPAMSRTQRTEFIKEKYYADLRNRISLGHFPALTNINKWEAALGVSRSTAIPVPYIPRIVVIPDYEKDCIIEDVWKIEECAKDTDQQKLVLAEKKKQREYFKAKKERRPSIAILETLPRLPNKQAMIRGIETTVPDQSEFKTFSGWDKANRRVKIDQIAHPTRVAEIKGELRPCYSFEQTEEIPHIEISEESIGLKRTVYPQYKNEQVQFFDGQGLMSFEFAERIGQHLGLSYSSNAVQGRLPYIKGNFIRFDILKWFENNNISKITDIFGESQSIIDERGRPIDLIITKSCFKAWHRYIEGQKKPECLFKNIHDYEKRLTEYQHTHFWVANYAKPSYQLNPYTPLTYQYIHALNLTLDDLYKLCAPLMKVVKIIVSGRKADTTNRWVRDIAYTKAFLNMLVQDHHEANDADDMDDSEDPNNELTLEQQKKFTSEINQAIDLNELMLYDATLRKYMIKQAMQKVQDMLKGRIPIHGSYYYMTNDPIAFMEHAVGKPVKGVLEQNQAFMNRKHGTHALFRSPLTIFNEVAKLEFIKVHNAYLRHLDNVIVLNCHDLTLIRLGLADVDGDTALCTNDSTILAAVIEAPTIINEDDKKVADPVPNDTDSVVKMELKSLHNLTGRCTNVNTFFQNLALEEGNLQSRVLENSVLKFLQGQIIDATKNGRDVEIPYVLDKFVYKLPYFFRFINGGTEDEYQRIIKSPFNKFCVEAEKYIKTTFQLKDGKLDQSMLGIESTKQLLQDLSKVNQSKYLAYLDLIEPLYKEYNKKKNRIDYRRKQFNELKKWERDDETRKAISEDYAHLKAEYKTKCEAICPFPSVLASVAVEIAYNKYGTHGFAWLFIDGLLENLKRHENIVKKEVRRVNRLTNQAVEGNELTVRDGVASVDDLEFRFDALDGVYPLFEIMGQFYISFETERKVNVQTSDTPTLLDGSSTRQKLEGYKMGFSTLKQSKDESQAVANEVTGKKMMIRINGNYVNVIDSNGDTKCCIPSDNLIQREEKWSLFDFDGAGIEFVSIEKVTKSSFKAIVNID
ncbi:hypothetical protein AV654_29260 [Paenibacillus elgii]|uniref:RDRP core domain-containing protein n=1 Tax=Paenibacillus elgii TaxID=189691 RepID=A0A163V5V1_9BACL|nr:hypothetical protein [Paenibacillus elgii]KZE74381.1 hypothetical protein AV654_29260 [Paenibacillus elgii]